MHNIFYDLKTYHNGSITFCYVDEFDHHHICNTNILFLVQAVQENEEKFKHPIYY